MHDLETGERLGKLALPGLGTTGGLIERPEGGHEAWFGYTDHTTTSTVCATTRQPGDLGVGDRPEASTSRASRPTR